MGGTTVWEISKNSKEHFVTSITKSLIRILGCAVAYITSSVEVFAIIFALAEILGIVEELVDERK
jgi:hypothetical protein